MRVETVTLALALALGGCSLGADARGDCGSGPCFGHDAGTEDPASDGGASGTDAGSPPRGDREGLDNAAECFDGRDNDGLDGSDCEDPACAAQPVCCVGVASAACCTARLPGAALPALDACAGGAVSRCDDLEGASVFGSPEPIVDAEGALVPNGGEGRDSGLVLAGELRPRTARITLRARIAAPAGCDGCIDAVAISLAPDDAIGPSVRGVAGLLVSGSRGDVSLLVGGAVAWTHPLPDAEPHEYELTVDPDGVVSLRTDAPGILAASVAAALPEDALRVVVHGRTTNRGASTEPPARLLALEVEASGCDMPAALARGAGPLIGGVVPWAAGTERAPSIARAEGAPASATRLAFAAGGTIWLAAPGDDGRFAAIGDGPVLGQSEAWPGGLGDPHLVPLESRWLLLATARDAAGRRRVVRVEGDDAWADAFDAGAARDLVALPIADPAGDVVELDGASAVRVGSELYVAARAIRASGETTLVLLGASADGAAGELALGDVCGTGCGSIDEAGTIAVHSARADDPRAFDHDEVAAPALVHQGGVYRLYYAGRRGTRWSIGLIVSYDLRFFRDGNGGAPVLGPSGDGADALGVLDPEPWAEEGTFVLLHTASDGVRTGLGRAVQPLPLRSP